MSAKLQLITNSFEKSKDKTTYTFLYRNMGACWKAEAYDGKSKYPYATAFHYEKDTAKQYLISIIQSKDAPVQTEEVSL